MSTNLIAGNRFTTDNNCLFIFDSAEFCIKDKDTGQMRFRRQSEKGL